MSAIAHKTAAFEVQRGAHGRPRAASVQPVVLRATEDGWSLLAPDGALIFRGLGLQARRECLELARGLGALAVIS